MTGGDDTRRLSRRQTVAVTLALGWSAALLVAAFVVPVYGTRSGSSDGGATVGSATLVAVNGPAVALVVAVPLLLSAATAAALVGRGRRRGAGVLAWVLAGVTGAFAVISLASIGLFVVPAVALLIYACAIHGSAVADPVR